MTDPRLKELIEQIDQTPFGSQERDLLYQGLEMAESLGDDRARYRLGLRLITSAKIADDWESALPVFLWCLEKNSADPVNFPSQPETHIADLIGIFRWVIAMFGQNPRFSIDQIDRMLTLFDDCLRRNQLPPNMGQLVRLRVFIEMGRLREVDEIVRDLPDDDEECLACRYQDQIDQHLLHGRGTAAAEALTQLTYDRVACSVQPESAMGRMLRTLAIINNFDEAQRSHRTSLLFATGGVEENIEVVARNIDFCAATGNLNQAVQLLNTYLPWVVRHRANQSAILTMWQAGWLTCQRLIETGIGITEISGASVLPELAGELSANALCAKFQRLARDLAADFDRRNGNQYRTQLLHITLTETVPQFELSDETGTADCEEVSDNWAIRLRDLWDSCCDTTSARSAVLNNPPSLAAEALACLAELSRVPDPATESRYLTILHKLGYGNRAEWWPKLRRPDLTELWRGAGQLPPDAAAIVARELLSRDPHQPALFDVLLAAATNVDEDQLRQDLLRWATLLALNLTDWERAKRCLDQLSAEPNLSDGAQLFIYIGKLQLHTGLGDYPAAKITASAAFQQAATLEATPNILLTAAAEYAQRAKDAQIGILTAKKQLAETDAEHRLAIQIQLGAYLVQLERFDEARRTLIATIPNAGDPELLQNAYFWLAECDEPNAENHLTTALDYADQTNDLVFQAKVGTKLAHLLIVDKRYSAAEAVLEKTLTTVNLIPNESELRARAWEQLGWLRTFKNDVSALTCFEYAIGFSTGLTRADILDSQARCCQIMGLLDRGVNIAKESSALYLTLNDPDSSLAAILVAVDILGRSKRFGSAKKLLAQVDRNRLSQKAQTYLASWQADLNQAVT